MKKQYKVWAKSITYCYLCVEAESADEALAIAEEADGGEFITSPEGDWEMLEAVED